MEFEGIWLEVRKSYATIRQVRSIDSRVLEQGQGVLWQYARRLRLDESDHIKKVVNFVEKVEDDRSISLLADMKYKGTCYTLTLFAIKR